MMDLLRQAVFPACDSLLITGSRLQKNEEYAAESVANYLTLSSLFRVYFNFKRIKIR